MQEYITQKISDLRKKRRYSMKELADMIGKTERTLLNYIGNRTKIDIDTLAEIAKALDVPVSYFFDDKAEGASGQSVKAMNLGSHGNSIHQNVSQNRGEDNSRDKIEFLKEIIEAKDQIIREKERMIEYLMKISGK